MSCYNSTLKYLSRVFSYLFRKPEQKPISPELREALEITREAKRYADYVMFYRDAYLASGEHDEFALRFVGNKGLALVTERAYKEGLKSISL